MAWPDWPWPPYFTTDLRQCDKPSCSRVLGLRVSYVAACCEPRRETPSLSGRKRSCHACLPDLSLTVKKWEFCFKFRPKFSLFTFYGGILKPGHQELSVSLQLKDVLTVKSVIFFMCVPTLALRIPRRGRYVRQVKLYESDRRQFIF